MSSCIPQQVSQYSRTTTADSCTLGNKGMEEIISYNFGGHTTVTGDVIEEILRLCKKKLVSGLLEFKPYNKESFQSWKENPGLKDFVADN
ncbi:hypothetical protein NQ318_015873 [Aromia moschata]|uniref:Uncharacterized protein n=1 Tax=Aromia moschata TaxID=1265417 RepID=A0AAV8YP64_9CUCU|nr:hypothetical protein NQ318_015873 [Aromia moschata]